VREDAGHPGNRVVDKKRIIGKNGGSRRRRGIHKGLLTQKIQIEMWVEANSGLIFPANNAEGEKARWQQKQGKTLYVYIGR
jgi:hypothetical protein